ncbi:sugar phosphate isomerase/epimerase family protein [Cohnella zeiphila]|uniref:Sugar phosphate isomerase/epimerase n=1 Tax=Cohnella zeiphila TaxID=2761120 RepID=A0A7X0SLQ1_9BACL|nr:sugar phosphate isomerase/epimerase [Cohnella zeiphila]MBB6732328.1 sugar phosphate isomerase/epimerase [Cohnella zeiphila]
MKLALYNSCLLHWEPERLFAWAAEQGFRGVELHGGPRFAHVDWSAVADGAADAKALLAAQERYGLPIVGLMYGALPFLSPDPDERRAAAQRIGVLLRAAARLGVPIVSTFTGRDPAKTLEQNLDGFADVFPAIADLAESLGVRLAFENCPMYEFWPPVHNIAVSPTMWRAMFELVPSPALGLNFDPSHLAWQGVDYARAVREFRDRIFIAQAKDTEKLPDTLREEGMLHHRWWRHRIPGQGDVDWSAFLTSLQEIGYDGYLSIEHEDPVWTGSDERVTKGLVLAKGHLERFI